jgi:type I restriction enzyme S subunit
MAADWRETTLGEVIELKRGYDLPQQHRTRGRVPLVSSSGVTDYHSVAMVKGPGVVTGRYGTLGQVFFVSEDYWPLNTTLYVRDFKGNDPRFISYFLQELDFLAYSDKAAVPGLNRNHLHQAQVRVPSHIDEQRAIAHILGTLDDKIEVNRRMNETLEAMALVLFKSWFIDFDPVRRNAAQGRNQPSPPTPLPGGAGRNAQSRNQPSPSASRHPLPLGNGRGEGVVAGEAYDHLFPDSFEDSELGEIPKGWKTRSLYETAEFINGAAFKSEDFCDPVQGLPVVKIAELKDGISAQTKFSMRLLDPKQWIETGELLYSWSGSPDTSLDAFLWTKGRGLLNQHIFKVVTPTISEKRFVYYLLKFLRSTLVEIARNKQTTGLGHVTVADMKRLHVCSPPLTVLAAFDHQVAPLFDRAFKSTLESQTLATLRDTLLPKLISGELWVPHLTYIAGSHKP